MIDTDKDGFITNLDLKDILTSLGKTKSDESIEKMVNEASSPINFTMFLTMFGAKMCGTDSEMDLRNAFSCFEEKVFSNSFSSGLSNSNKSWWAPFIACKSKSLY